MKLAVSKVHQSGYLGVKERERKRQSCDIDAERFELLSHCATRSDKANWQCCGSRILSLLIRNVSDEGHVQQNDF